MFCRFTHRNTVKAAHARCIRKISYCACLLFLAATSIPVLAASIDPGSAKYTVELRGLPMDVFTYRPNCPATGILVVIHGVEHRADGYRNVSRSLATVYA